MIYSFVFSDDPEKISLLIWWQLLFLLLDYL